MIEKFVLHSKIYCNGHLLKTVQLAAIYPDSKTFVDMKLKVLPAKILAIYNEWITSFNNATPTKDDMLKFIDVKIIFVLLC